MRANPWIDDPNRIYAGWSLNLPMKPTTYQHAAQQGSSSAINRLNANSPGDNGPHVPTAEKRRRRNNNNNNKPSPGPRNTPAVNQKLTQAHRGPSAAEVRRRNTNQRQQNIQQRNQHEAKLRRINRRANKRVQRKINSQPTPQEQYHNQVQYWKSHGPNLGSVATYNPPAPKIKIIRVGNRSLKQKKEPPEPPSLQKFLANDTTYQRQLANYRKALQQFIAGNKKSRQQVRQDFNTAQRRLSRQRGIDLSKIQADYAGRGLLHSGLYAKARGRYNKKYQQNLSDLTQSKQRNIQELVSAAHHRKSLINTKQQAAKLRATQRRAQKFNLTG